MEHMRIRMATIDDLDAITSVEAECFPPAEAATKEEFARRIKAYGTHFWLLCEKGYEGEKLIAFVDGMVTDKKDLTDEMCKKAERNVENSCIAKTSCGQSIFNERKRNGCDGNTSWRKNSFGRSGDGLSTTNFVQSPWSSGA